MDGTKECRKERQDGRKAENMDRRWIHRRKEETISILAFLLSIIGFIFIILEIGIFLEIWVLLVPGFGKIH